MDPEFSWPSSKINMPGTEKWLEGLRDAYPHGHPDFIPKFLELVKLHSDKNHDYAMGGPPLGNFERVAEIMRLYPDFPWATPVGAATVYMFKQLDAFLWQTKQGFEAKIEGAAERLRDVTVYSQLIAIMLKTPNPPESSEHLVICDGKDHEGCG